MTNKEFNIERFGLHHQTYSSTIEILISHNALQVVVVVVVIVITVFMGAMKR